MKKYFNNFKLSNKEKHQIIKTYKKGDVSCFFSSTIKSVEKGFSEFMGGGYSLAVTNCTSALYLAYKVLDIKEDEHIIMPNYTHPSTAFAAKTANVKMKFCDSQEDSYNLNIKHLKKLINKKTRAIVFVHLRGLKQNIEEVKSICEKHKIVLIEDVAQGFGIKFGQKLAGSFGDISCFSFNDSKTIQLGEGGMCLFKNKELEQKARIIVHEGEISNTFNLSTTISNGTILDVINKQFIYGKDGFNFRPFPPIFSILLGRLRNLEKLRSKKLKIASNFSQNLNKTNLINMEITEDDLPICYPVLTKDLETKTNILLNTYNTGYPIGKMAYPTLNKIESLKESCLNGGDNFTNSENLFDKLIFLPLSTNITKKEAVNLVKHLNKVATKNIENSSFDSKEIRNFDGLYLW